MLTHTEADLQQTQQQTPQQDAQQRRPQVTQAVTVPLTAPAASAASSGNGAYGAGNERVTCRADGATFGAGRGQCNAAGIHAWSTTTDFGLAAPSTTHAVKGWRAANTQVVWLIRQAPQGAVPKIMPAQPVTTTPVVPQAVLQVMPAVTMPTAALGAAEQVVSSGLGQAVPGVGSGDELCSPGQCLGEVSAATVAADEQPPTVTVPMAPATTTPCTDEYDQHLALYEAWLQGRLHERQRQLAAAQRSRCHARQSQPTQQRFTNNTRGGAADTYSTLPTQ